MGADESPPTDERPEEKGGPTSGVHDDLHPAETLLVGQWLDTGNRYEGDAVTARIQWLVGARLERLADLAGSGDGLYRDPRDGRIWELTHPHGEIGAGGPPALRLVAPGEAPTRYGVEV